MSTSTSAIEQQVFAELANSPRAPALRRLSAATAEGIAQRASERLALALTISSERHSGWRRRSAALHVQVREDLAMLGVFFASLRGKRAAARTQTETTETPVVIAGITGSLTESEASLLGGSKTATRRRR